MDTSAPSGRPSYSRWPALATRWPALAIVLAGLVVTWFTAQSVKTIADQLRSQQVAEQHQTMTHQLSGGVSQLLYHSQRLAPRAEEGELAFRNHLRALASELPGILGANFLVMTEGQSDVIWSEYPLGDSQVTEVLPSPVLFNWEATLARALASQEITVTGQTRMSVHGQDRDVLMVFVPVGENELITLIIEPQRWLAGIFSDHITSWLQVQVHDLDQYGKVPLFSTHQDVQLGAQATLRSEVPIANRRWMLTSTPIARSVPDPREQSWKMAWILGLLFTAVAAALAYWLSRQLGNARHQASAEAEACLQTKRQLENAQVEKSILRQALNDSELRSRDLVELSGSMISEMDEDGIIGFISSRAADLLSMPPADLAGKPFEQLVAPESRDNFQATLNAARQEKQTQRIDLDLLNADQEPVPATVRVKVQQNPVDGCTGFRLSAQRRYS